MLHVAMDLNIFFEMKQAVENGHEIWNLLSGASIYVRFFENRIKEISKICQI
jgi:hypothetical protein